MRYDLSLPEDRECFQRRVEEVESAVMTMQGLIKNLPEEILKINKHFDIDYAIHLQPSYAVSYMLKHLREDLSEMFESVLESAGGTA